MIAQFPRKEKRGMNEIRGVFRTQSNILNGTFSQK